VLSDPGPNEDALQRAQSVLCLLPVAVAQASAEKRFLWVSDRYAEWLGVPRDQVVGHSIDEILGAESAESMRPHIDSALGGQATEGEVEVFHETLGPRWVHLACVPTLSPSGVPDGWIEAIIDVTERHRTAERLQENQNTLQSFYDSSPFFMGLVELDGDSILMLYCNRAMLRVLGTTLDQTAHHPVDGLVTPDQAREWVVRYRQAQRDGAPVQFEYEHQLASGTRWLRATVAFLGEGPHGRPRFSFVAEEITEHKRVIAALQEANRSKDEFLAMLGHELRNPLSPIVTAVQILRLRGNGQYAKALEVVQRQVQYLIRLVDDLLDVSRVTRGNIQIEKHLLRLQDVVAEGAEMVMPLIEQRRHRLDVRFPPSDLRLNGDESRLAQVVSNLLTNAAKYTDPGGELAIEGRQEGDAIVLTVKDTGIGISPALLPHVFDLFTQERQSADRARGGLGIGLTIVRKLVELHGGTVRAQSDGLGKGSLFTVRLPAAAEEPAAVERHSTPPPIVTKAPSQILVVDDNEDALDLLADALRDAGHVVATAKDGPSALAALKTFQPDVAILDIGLPVMDGYELAGRLRASLGEAAPPLIALTGYGQASDRDRAREAGFFQHLTKPVDLGYLLGVLDAARLGHRQQAGAGPASDHAS
jgi:PAS domain S-box-containing protein